MLEWCDIIFSTFWSVQTRCLFPLSVFISIWVGKLYSQVDWQGTQSKGMVTQPTTKHKNWTHKKADTRNSLLRYHLLKTKTRTVARWLLGEYTAHEQIPLHLDILVTVRKFNRSCSYHSGLQSSQKYIPTNILCQSFKLYSENLSFCLNYLQSIQIDIKTVTCTQPAAEGPLPDQCGYLKFKGDAPVSKNRLSFVGSSYPSRGQN